MYKIKRLSSVLTSFMSYAVIVTYACMIIVPSAVTGHLPDDNFLIMFTGYSIIGIILYSVVSCYVNVEIDLETHDIILFTSVLNRKKVLKKDNIVTIKKLGWLYASPTYYIKYVKANRKTGYYLFTKDLNTDIERYLVAFR